MATQIQRNSLTRLLCTLVLSSVLMACGIGPLQKAPLEPAPDMFGITDRSAEQYLARAEQAPEPDAFSWRVLAIRAWLQQGNVAAAEPQLERLRQQATLAQLPLLTLLEGATALAAGNTGLAGQRLAAVDTKALAPDAAGYYLLLQANRFEQQQPIDAAKMLIERHDTLAGQEQNAGLERIYQLLTQASPLALRQAQNDDNSEAVNGWLRLMAILNDTHAQPGQRRWQLQSWRKAYPNHPGHRYLSDSAEPAARLDAYQPAHIAVLLPLGGQLAEQADAIRNGMLSAHQGQASRLSFFDTNGRDMARLYQDIQQAGVDFILGPLLKENIDALTSLDPALPVFALNRPAHQPVLPHRYYFSLSPEAEAAEAAYHMWEQGHHQPLVFAPGNELGRRVAAEFNNQWQRLSGQQARLAYFNNQQSIESDVRRALNSGNPAVAGVGVIRGSSEVALPAGPIDSVFMVSNTTETRFILPYFDFVRDSRAARLPTYVTSRSYVPGGEPPMSELNGLQLADMPWLFGGAPQLMEEVETLWPTVGSSWLRLFAFGYDALTLIPQLTQLREGAPPVPALSGLLSLGEDGVVQRRLQWMEYRDGEWQSGNEQPVPGE
ncbi:penicillin-binding protein activator [uncultured Oceanisphaera sp.]|uniref:penicillin-binding protein activator n=1 Tax=uncultured Oceanisphaera sp. TaxID=353858 RepID=UPI00261DD445|nr:penicillin-binding protein activator [uncultured Oceanisphaera sp.]